jgi:hypothetical protein
MMTISPSKTPNPLGRSAARRITVSEAISID